ncbi:MAG: DMT family transporter [Nitrospirota bacterium]|nr:DMT family transporter [Nitrospirota bacterium]
MQPSQSPCSGNPTDAQLRARSAHWTGTLLVVTTAICFSAKPVLVKLVYQSAGGIEPITVMAARLMFSVPLFVFIALWSNRPGRVPLTGRDWAQVGGLALLGYYLSQLLDTAGLAYISAGLERVVLFAYPTLVVVISAMLYRRGVERGTVPALVLTWAGVALAVSGHLGLPRSNGTLGVALVLGAAFTFALYSVGSAPVISKLGATRFTALAMCGSSLAVGLHFGLSGATSPLTLPAGALMFSAVMALFATVLPAFCFSAGVALVGAPRAAILSTVGPVATLGLDSLALGEPLTATHLVGTVLVLAGVTVIGLSRRC